MPIFNLSDGHKAEPVTHTTEHPLTQTQNKKPATRNAKPAKSAKPAAKKPASASAKSEPAKAAVSLHDTSAISAATLAFAASNNVTLSNIFRGAKAKPRTPIDAARHAGANATARDETFTKAVRDIYGAKPFPRLDVDAGNLSRAIALGRLAAVDPNHTTGRDAQFKLTA